MLIVYKHRTNSAGTPRKVASKVGGNFHAFPSLVYVGGNWICTGRIDGHRWSAAPFVPPVFFHRTWDMQHSCSHPDPISATDRLICPVNFEPE